MKRDRYIPSVYYQKGPNHTTRTTNHTSKTALEGPNHTQPLHHSHDGTVLKTDSVAHIAAHSQRMKISFISMQIENFF